MEIAIVKQDLETLEGVIKKNLAAFYEVGRALMEIRDRRLYKEVKGYKTFEEYCRVEWDFSKTHANRLIESTKTIEVLTPIGVKAPTTESQTRPLTQLEPEQQVEAWEEAVETAPDGKVTAAHVTRVVEKVKPDSNYQHRATGALQFATIAISQLERIKDSDPQKEEAFDRVLIWITNRLKG